MPPQFAAMGGPGGPPRGGPRPANAGGRGGPMMPPMPGMQQAPMMQMQGPGGVLPPNVGRGRGAYKYTPNARNAPNMGGAAPNMPSRPALTPSTLAAMPEEQQKRMLGEALFPLIQSQNATFAGKVTGMLLEMDNGELLHLLESPDALRSKVEEAVGVLEEHMKSATDAE